jgi:large subunit ribosomal protein L30
MIFAVIRVRGSLRVKPDIKETLSLLRLNRVNHCILMPDTPEYKGMLFKVKDYVTWGEVDVETLTELIRQRGKIEGGNPVTDDFIKSRSSFKDAGELAGAIVESGFRFKDLDGTKPIFRLSPPNKGGYEGIKRSFNNGGALGYRGKEINDLLKRMI